MRRLMFVPTLLCVASVLPACGKLLGLSEEDTPSSGSSDAIAEGEPFDVITTEGDASIDAPSDAGGKDVKDVKDVKDPPCQVNCQRIAFVTSAIYRGGLGGTSGADAICDQAASEANLQSKTFKAWLGTANVSPAARFENKSGTYSLPISGTLVANSFSELASAVHSGAINRNAAGQPTTAHVWTGTNATLGGSALDCVGWTTFSAAEKGTYGLSDNTDVSWTFAGDEACNAQNALYCIED